MNLSPKPILLHMASAVLNSVLTYCTYSNKSNFLNETCYNEYMESE